MDLSLIKIPKYYIAIILGLVLHVTLCMFTFEKTYDAFVHLFFANHYATDWFSSWSQKWYTGFTITSYPPLVHQGIALLSKIVGLKGGFIIWAGFVVILLIRGIYHFSLLWVNEKAATYAAFLGVFSTSIGEALHVFGQLPSLTGSAILLNICPQVYRWLRYDQKKRLILSLLLFAVISSAHHVTTIFGMVFFVFPVIGVAIYDRINDRNIIGQKVNLIQYVKEIIRVSPRLIFFGITTLLLTLVVIFPYWYWTKTDPIAQIPIPHGSRDSFIENLSSGLVFFLIPWGMMLFFLPYFFKKVTAKRILPLGLSAILLFVLGTGGTTPIPRFLLGSNAFDILTLDRFTFWATLIALPFWGSFIYDLFEGNYKYWLLTKMGRLPYRIIVSSLLFGILFSFFLIVNIGSFRSMQPERIDIEPITNFLEKDQHGEWRYLTLGFGDQMAWLSANTDALSVDGNYHSARRLPELTNRPVERLENAKFQKEHGLSSLREFLSHPDKYHLKFIFSNDRFYDPLLFNNGWVALQRLDNGITVWEKPDIKKLPAVIPSRSIPKIQQLIWSYLPMTCFFLLFLFGMLIKIFGRKDKETIDLPDEKSETALFFGLQSIWLSIIFILILLFCVQQYVINHDHKTPENIINSYYNHLDFKRFEDAYACLNPNTRPSKEDFLLQLSVQGGIISSYAKLDSLELRVSDYSMLEEAVIEVKANYLTAMMPYQNTYLHKVTKLGKKWFVESLDIDDTEPILSFNRSKKIEFHSQGRRTIDAMNTAKRDILDRPVVDVIESNLIKRNDHEFHVVGEIRNIDVDPAHLSIQAILYDEEGKEILSANAKDVLSYFLLPQESTVFKVEFDQAIIDHSLESKDIQPKKIRLIVNTVVSDESFYRDIGLSFIHLDSSTLHLAEIYNYGTEQVVIPKILQANYNEKHELHWVGHQYLPFGIRPGRKQLFSMKKADTNSTKIVLKASCQDIIINGKLNCLKTQEDSRSSNQTVKYFVHSFTKTDYLE